MNSVRVCVCLSATVINQLRLKKYSRVLERYRACVIFRKYSRILERRRACAIFRKYSRVLERHRVCVILRKYSKSIGETTSVCEF